MLKRLFTVQNLWPYLALFAAFSAICTFLGDFRFSDPDLYFHLTVSREWAENWNIWQLPQVIGMGWDQFFNDKEFLFHLLTAAGYKIAGDSGVVFTVHALSFLVPVLVYQILFHLTERKDLALFGALALFLSDTFVMHMMLVRAYILSLVLILLIIHNLLANKKRSLLVACFFFSWSYHAIYVPISILMLYLATETYLGKRNLLPLWGMLAIIAGSVFHPFFPDNYRMTLVHLQIVKDQFHTTDLPFGMEQVPFRSDNMILVFRFSFLFLLLGIGVLWHSFYESSRIKKPEGNTLFAFLFFALLTCAFFCLLFLSPRIQIYFIPFVTLFGTLAVHCFKKQKFSLTLFAVLCLLITICAWPYKNFRESIEAFHQVNTSYLEIAKKVPPSKNVFNCEWWGGNYAIYANPEIRVLDVLDPELLRARDLQLFEAATQLRLAKTLDPHFMIRRILKYDYVLCSAETPLHKQLSRDPRFESVAETQNSAGALTLFEVLAEPKISALLNVETRKDISEWKLRPREINGVPLPGYTSENSTEHCTWIRPQPEDERLIQSNMYFVFSGTGTLTITKGDQPYLSTTPLPDDLTWGELVVPITDGQGEWRFKVCPRSRGGSIALGIFLMNENQKQKWCEGSDKKNLFFQKPDLCSGITAHLNK